jgi:PAS domain S-box-containing protein
MEPDNEIVIEGDRTDAVRQDRLWFLEGMDRVNQAIQDTEDLQQTIHVLDAMLSIFGGDRAWIVYPCDPDSKTLRTVADCARPTFTHSVPVGVDVPMEAATASVHRLVSASEGPVCFGTETNEAISDGSERLGVRSQICLAIHPKIDKPYLLGLDQCTHARNWTQQEQRLFEAIGQRIATLLTSLLLSRDLQENKARLEEAQRVAHVGYWDWNLETGEVIWSDETYRIFGFKPQEQPMNIATVSELVHPDDREALYSAVEVEVAGGVHPAHEHRIVRPSGEVRTVHSITSKLWSAMPGDLENGASGKPHRLFGTVQDITELKRAEEARHALSRDLQESTDWLEEAQRVAHLGYWVWDLETNQVIWSEETYRIFGVAPQVGSFDIGKVSEMIHPDDREVVFRTAEEAIRSGMRADSEHRLIRPDGEMRIVHSLGDLKTTSAGRTQMFGTTQDITDRKRVEEDRQTLSRALQQSNARLEEAQRVAHIGHYEFNPVENHVTWSAELCRIWGLPPMKGPIEMTLVFEMIHPEDREYAARTIEETIRSGTHLKAEHRIVRPNGEVRFLQVLGTVKRDASGHAYELFGTCQDITDRKLAEQALRRNQFYLSEGERLAHMGSWASTDLGIRWSDELDIYWSDEVYKIYGLDPKNGTASLQQHLAAIHPQDRDSMAETIQLMHEQHCGCDITTRIVRPDGEIRYVRCVGIPVVEDGVFQGFHGTTMDVTEQELLTQELRREQAYLTDAQSMAHIGSWAYNLVTRKLLHSSDENARLYGFNPSQGPIPAERFFDTQHVEDAPYVNAALERAVREGTDFYLDEYRIHHTDGSIRFLRAIGHRNVSGEPGEYVGVTMDITDRKRAEEERERLRQLEADLAHINRVNMMGELAAALAHEIKQPIAASITSANACLRWLGHNPPDLERARAAAARIDREGNRAADIINSLRSFYKTGTPTERQSVDVKGAIREMTALLRTEAARHSVTIRAHYEADMPHILADRVQLQQVLMNLMLNAIEAMKDTGGELTIRSGANSEGLAVSISDTGVGLPAEGLDLIFDPFHTTKPQGTGMGLTITRSIVESYGGRVWATANQGPGATFHFTLPTGAEAHA